MSFSLPTPSHSHLLFLPHRPLSGCHCCYGNRGFGAKQTCGCQYVGGRVAPWDVLLLPKRKGVEESSTCPHCLLAKQDRDGSLLLKTCSFCVSLNLPGLPGNYQDGGDSDACVMRGCTRSQQHNKQRNNPGTMEALGFKLENKVLPAIGLFTATEYNTEDANVCSLSS